MTEIPYNTVKIGFLNGVVYVRNQEDKFLFRAPIFMFDENALELIGSILGYQIGAFPRLVAEKYPRPNI